MIVALLRRLSARSSRTVAFALLAASLCAQDKDAAPLPWNDAVPPCSPEHVARAFEGAGHAFMSRQPGANTPNHTAAAAAWPLTVAFLRRHVD